MLLFVISTHIIGKGGFLMVYCPKCYRKNPDENQYCSNCGHKLQKSNPAPPEQAQAVMYCSHCGSQISPSAAVCLKCGCAVNGGNHSADKPSFVLDMISVFCPLIGFILFCVFHGNYPLKAKSVGIASLVGIVAVFSLPLIFRFVIWLSAKIA